MKRGLSTQQKKVALELVQSDISGKTIADIAEEYNVTERTVYRWKNDPEFATELDRLTDINLKAFTYEATNKLKSLIRNGHSEQAILGGIKLIMQTQGKLRDVQEITTDSTQDIKNNGVSKDMLAEIDAMLDES